MNRRTFLAAGTAAALALRAAAVPKLTPELKPKPEVAKALADLKPGHAVLLGKADVVGEFNDTAKKYDLHKTGPKGRDFTNKMCWAPDRQRALFCGANHAVPHRINDVWEFDLPSLTWAMLYAPDLPRGYTDLGKDTSDVEFKDGLFVTKRGGPGIIAHTWWGLTYDPEKKALLFMNTWVTEKKKMAEALGGDAKDVYDGPPLWAYLPAEGKWKSFKAEKPYPPAIFGGWLEFIPDVGTVWHANNWQAHGTWKLDYDTGNWKDLKCNGDAKAFEKEAAEPEQIGYYDPKRKLLVSQRHYATHHYDVKKNEWKKVLSGNKEDGLAPFGHDARSVMHHDPASGQGLLTQFDTEKQEKSNTVWAYDPDKTAWTKLKPDGDPMPAGGKKLGYVDPAANVLVVLDGVNVWVYRHAKG